MSIQLSTLQNSQILQLEILIPPPGQTSSNNKNSRTTLISIAFANPLLIPRSFTKLQSCTRHGNARNDWHLGNFPRHYHLIALVSLSFSLSVVSLPCRPPLGPVRDQEAIRGRRSRPDPAHLPVSWQVATYPLLSCSSLVVVVVLSLVPCPLRAPSAFPLLLVFPPLAEAASLSGPSHATIPRARRVSAFPPRLLLGGNMSKGAARGL